MTIQQIRRAPFELAQPDPRRYGLLSVATIRDNAPWISTEGGVVTDLGISWNCASGDFITYECSPSTITKQFRGPMSVSGSLFWIYLGGECKGPGVDVKAEIRRGFLLRESFLVERGFQVNVLGVPASNAVTLTVDVGMLAHAESDMRAYAGAPTIHLGVYAATILAAADAIELTPSGWMTPTGSKVVIGAGYNPDLVAGSGEVTLARSDLVDATAFGTDTNTMRILVERLYLASADCIIAVESGGD